MGEKHNRVEQWEDVPGFEGRYQASNLGHIRSLPRAVPCGKPKRNGERHTRISPGKVLSAGKASNGYLTVSLGRRNTIPVHTLVAATFLGPRPKGHDVCHINGDPCDNRLENLRYDSRAENILDVYRIGRAWRKLTLADIQTIERLIDSGAATKLITAQFRISESTVSSIRRKRYKACTLS